MSVYQSIPLLSNEISSRFIDLKLERNENIASHGAVCIQMEACALHSAPRYEALSYVWGEQADLLSLQLNNHTISVSQNLHSALQQLRLGSSDEDASTRRLWVDAICINQSDNAEKSQQVMQMTEIYAGADRVLVWLGEPDELSSLAFDTLTRFAADDGTADGSLTYQNILSTMAEREAAIRLLVQRPYWGRVWVIQETVAAKKATVLCGSLTLSFDDLYLAFIRMTGSGFYPFTPTTARITELGHWRVRFLQGASPERDEESDLQVLLMTPRNKECMNLRDKVYSLRGIAGKTFAGGIVVNYN